MENDESGSMSNVSFGSFRSFGLDLARGDLVCGVERKGELVLLCCLEDERDGEWDTSIDAFGELG